MQARNREFRGLNAERESGRPDFEVGKAGSNPVSAIEKEVQEKKRYKRKSCILGCRQSRHPKSKSGFRLAKTEE